MSVKRNNWIKTGFIWCLFILLACLPVQAAEPKGSITLQLPVQAAGVEVTLYTIADFQDGNYVYRPEFADSGLVIHDLRDTDQAQKAAEQWALYAQNNKIKGETKMIGPDGTAVLTDLSQGLYLVAQTGGRGRLSVQPSIVPVPYTSDNAGGWIYDAVIAPKHSFPGGAVIVLKVDDEGNAVGNAEFMLEQKTYVKDEKEVPEGADGGSDKGGIYYWKKFKANLISSEHGQVVIKDMPVGSYRFIETSAPDGYVMTEAPGYFTIEEAGEVREADGIYTPSSGKVEELTVVNTQTHVKINKVDRDGKPVQGAKLVVKPAQGDDQAVFSFVTSAQPYDLKRLPAGKYLLSEVEAPEGYRISRDVAFTVDGKSDAVIEVTMVDEKEEKTDISLKVTKKLTKENGQELKVKEATFYVALFEDPGRTKRVSNVLALHYKGESSSTVTFDNLEQGRTYYVGETDEFGRMIMEMEAASGGYKPDYPDGYEVKPEGETEFAFKNVFYEKTPEKPNAPYGGGSSGGSGGGSSVKTGDETPVGWYAALLALAVAAIVMLSRKKKTKRQ